MPPPDLRTRLAQALAMLEREGIVDFNGHVSARGPDEGGTPTLLINAGDSVRSRIRPQDFVRIDLDGRLVEGTRPPPMEFHLHAQIYRARPDVQAVVHAHPRWSTVVGLAGHDWAPVTMQAAVLGEVATYGRTVSINTADLGREVAAVLGDRRAALMHRHGAVCVGATIEIAFAHAVYLEENARRQHEALQVGRPQPLDPAECADIGRHLARPALLRKVWDFHLGRHFPQALDALSEDTA